VLANGSKIMTGYTIYDMLSNTSLDWNLMLQIDKREYSPGETITIPGTLEDYNTSSGNSIGKQSVTIYRVNPFVSID
jgi:hypothetical protein